MKILSVLLLCIVALFGDENASEKFFADAQLLDEKDLRCDTKPTYDKELGRSYFYCKHIKAPQGAEMTITKEIYKAKSLHEAYKIFYAGISKIEGQNCLAPALQTRDFVYQDGDSCGSTYKWLGDNMLEIKLDTILRTRFIQKGDEVWLYSIQ
ncbi:hypothetical protein ACWIWK_06995 [Helicobacter sp. 23-1048]